MLQFGTDPEPYITENTLIYEDKTRGRVQLDDAAHPLLEQGNNLNRVAFFHKTFYTVARPLLEPFEE